MTREELSAKINAASSMEDAYNLAKEEGYTGSLEDFTALCRQAAEDISKDGMNLDDMEAVAGGNGFTDTVGDIYNWCKDNPVAAAAIGAGAAGAIAAVAYGVHYYRSSQTEQLPANVSNVSAATGERIPFTAADIQSGFAPRINYSAIAHLLDDSDNVIE